MWWSGDDGMIKVKGLSRMLLYVCVCVAMFVV